MIRRPVVAGQFYPGARDSLKLAVEGYLTFDAKPKKVIGLATPHAGYIYSGKTAGHTFASAVIPQRCIILAPNHTGRGATAAIMTSGDWATPIGNISIDKDLCEKLISNTSLLKEDADAHVGEHSLEVQLPFLQFRQPILSIVPICLQRLGAERCRELGVAIANTIRKSGEDVLIVASTDMNHYESQETTIKKDNLAIERVLALDPEGLIHTCAEYNITMCGVIPTAVMLYAAKELGAKTAELVEHTTSGDASGDYDAVVGYAGFLVY